MQADLRWSSLILLNAFAVESAGSYYLLRRAHQAESEHIRRFSQWLLAERDIFEADIEKSSLKTNPPPATSAKQRHRRDHPTSTKKKHRLVARARR
jgi:hypothetical protein